jgi:hypothetical protein
LGRETIKACASKQHSEPPQRVAREVIRRIASYLHEVVEAAPRIEPRQAPPLQHVSKFGRESGSLSRGVNRPPVILAARQERAPTRCCTCASASASASSSSLTPTQSLTVNRTSSRLAHWLA